MQLTQVLNAQEKVHNKRESVLQLTLSLRSAVENGSLTSLLLFLL